jgi:hypothetical protein
MRAPPHDAVAGDLLAVVLVGLGPAVLGLGHLVGPEAVPEVDDVALVEAPRIRRR